MNDIDYKSFPDENLIKFTKIQKVESGSDKRSSISLDFTDKKRHEENLFTQKSIKIMVIIVFVLTVIALSITLFQIF
jgi:hypothetical protein